MAIVYQLADRLPGSDLIKLLYLAYYVVGFALGLGHDRERWLADLPDFGEMIVDEDELDADDRWILDVVVHLYGSGD